MANYRDRETTFGGRRIVRGGTVQRDVKGGTGRVLPGEVAGDGLPLAGSGERGADRRAQERMSALTNGPRTSALDNYQRMNADRNPLAQNLSTPPSPRAAMFDPMRTASAVAASTMGGMGGATLASAPRPAPLASTVAPAGFPMPSRLRPEDLALGKANGLGSTSGGRVTGIEDHSYERQAPQYIGAPVDTTATHAALGAAANAAGGAMGGAGGAMMAAAPSPGGGHMQFQTPWGMVSIHHPGAATPSPFPAPAPAPATAPNGFPIPSRDLTQDAPLDGNAGERVAESLRGGASDVFKDATRTLGGIGSNTHGFLRGVLPQPIMDVADGIDAAVGKAADYLPDPLSPSWWKRKALGITDDITGNHAPDFAPAGQPGGRYGGTGGVSSPLPTARPSLEPTPSELMKRYAKNH